MSKRSLATGVTGSCGVTMTRFFVSVDEPVDLVTYAFDRDDDSSHDASRRDVDEVVELSWCLPGIRAAREGAR